MKRELTGFSKIALSGLFAPALLVFGAFHHGVVFWLATVYGSRTIVALSCVCVVDGRWYREAPSYDALAKQAKRLESELERTKALNDKLTAGLLK